MPSARAEAMELPGNGMRRGSRTRAVPIVRGVVGAAVLLAAWEWFSHSGAFSKAITPPLEVILPTLFRLMADGTLPKHTAATLLRVFAGLSIALLIAVPTGMAMGQSKFFETMLKPVVNVLMPIPSLAWVPLVVLWFGIGNVATVLVVVYAATFPLLYNVWSGARAVNPLWIRAGTIMDARGSRMFRHIIWPAALPYVITGMRQSFGRAWIAVIGGELLASPEWGLGKLIFDAKEYLNADVMLAALIVIGVIGLFFERVVFQWLENVTVNRWGMSTGAKR